MTSAREAYDAGKALKGLRPLCGCWPQLIKCRRDALQAWRLALRGWLALLGGLKGAKGLHRWREVQRAVALQLTDVEPAVQQAALRSLKVQTDWLAS